MEQLRLEKTPKIRRAPPWNVPRQSSHAPRQRPGKLGNKHFQRTQSYGFIHKVLSACARVYRAVLDRAGAFTYRLSTEQLILSLNHPREDDRTRRFGSGLPRLLLQPLAAPAQFPHGGAYDRIQEEGLFSWAPSARENVWGSTLCV